MANQGNNRKVKRKDAARRSPDGGLLAPNTAALILPGSVSGADRPAATTEASSQRVSKRAASKLPATKRVARKKRVDADSIPAVPTTLPDGLTLPNKVARKVKTKAGDVNLPQSSAAPIKMFGATAAGRAEGTASKGSRRPPTAQGSSVDPLWYSLFAPDAKPRQTSFGGTNGPRLFDDSAAPAPGGINLLPEPTLTREDLEEPKPQFGAWQYVELVLSNRRVAQGLAATLAFVFVTSMNVRWRDWVGVQLDAIRAPIARVMNAAGRPIRERAAFFIVDDFSRGLTSWASENPSVEINPSGWLKVGQGLALHKGTMELESYRLDFDAKIVDNAVGWAVRAPNTDNYYAFKLNEKLRAGSRQLSLQRFKVIDGIRDAVGDAIDVPDHLAQFSDFNRISVRVVDDRMTTLINGWGVDFWRDATFDRGGVGLIADAGESALVRKMAVSGNEDTWGLILYGTLESLRSVQDAVSSPFALVLTPVPPQFLTQISPEPGTILIQGR